MLIKVVSLLLLDHNGRMKNSQILLTVNGFGWEGGGRQEGMDGNGWTVGHGLTRTGMGMSQAAR